MLPATLPFELLDEISKCIEGDHGTLYSCALVNKQWHYASIPKLWREPFYCKDSTKILINCLFAQDKDFFRRNCIELPLGLLLDKPPMHNYGMFATYLDFDQNFNNALDEIIDTNQCLRKRLLEFVLEYSIIRGFAIFENNCNWLVSHHGFDMWFQKLGELTCNHSNKSKFFHRVANTCKNIQTLRIYFCSFDEKSSYGLVQLIKAQKQIKKLILHGGYNNPILSDNLKEALSIHSQSIVHYEGRGETGLDSLIGTFCNLKILKLELSNHETEVLESIKSISFPNIETVDLYITYQSFLSNMSEFIKVNGKNLKNLHINGDPEDKDCLGELFQSISQYCQNLERLSIFYNNELDKWLLEIFKNCDKLQYIRLKAPHWKYIFNGDKIITTLNQSLPRCLEDIHFVQNIDFYDRDSLNVLIDNWRGPYHFIKIIKTLSGI